MLTKFKKKFIGDKNFYLYVFGIVVPMILQNIITSFVSLLDNIMVGRIGTEQMSGVAITNQLIFVFQLTIFGAVSGAGIFGAQYFGKGDHKGQMYTVRIRLIIGLIVTAVFYAIFYFMGESLISLFLNESTGEGDIALTLQYGSQYMRIMLLTIPLFGIGQSYASAVRECGYTQIPMMASFAAVFANLILDYGLIFGRLGMPQMGVKGAAIATVIAKLIEALVIIVWIHTHPKENRYLEGLYGGLSVPGKLFAGILSKGFPLMLNETLWSIGMTTLLQCFSTRGLEAVAAINVANTMINLVNIVFMQIGASVSIIVGQQLGAGDLERAKDYSNKIIFISMMISIVMALVTYPLAAFFPLLYNTQDSIRDLATFFIRVTGFMMPMHCYVHWAYFTLRSGGRSGITFLFDSGYVWVIMIPVAYSLAHFTNLGIRYLYPLTYAVDIVKVVMGFFMIRSGIWLRNLVND